MKDYDIDWEKLVIARLCTMPVDLTVSTGAWEGNSLDLICEVQKHTEIGKTFVAMEKEYLQSLSRGELWKILSSK